MSDNKFVALINSFNYFYQCKGQFGYDVNFSINMKLILLISAICALDPACLDYMIGSHIFTELSKKNDLDNNTHKKFLLLNCPYLVRYQSLYRVYICSQDIRFRKYIKMVYQSFIKTDTLAQIKYLYLQRFYRSLFFFLPPESIGYCTCLSETNIEYLARLQIKMLRKL